MYMPNGNFWYVLDTTVARPRELVESCPLDERKPGGQRQWAGVSKGGHVRSRISARWNGEDRVQVPGMQHSSRGNRGLWSYACVCSTRASLSRGHRSNQGGSRACLLHSQPQHRHANRTALCICEVYNRPAHAGRSTPSSPGLTAPRTPEPPAPRKRTQDGRVTGGDRGRGGQGQSASKDPARLIRTNSTTSTPVTRGPCRHAPSRIVSPHHSPLLLPPRFKNTFELNRLHGFG